MWVDFTIILILERILRFFVFKNILLKPNWRWWGSSCSELSFAHEDSRSGENTLKLKCSCAYWSVARMLFWEKGSNNLHIKISLYHHFIFNNRIKKEHIFEGGATKSVFLFVREWGELYKQIWILEPKENFSSY